MHQDIRNDLFGLSVYKNGKYILLIMIFQEGLDLFSDPYGLTCPCGTDNYQLIGVGQCHVYIFIKVTGNRKFFLVAEDPLNSFNSCFFNNGFGNAESLKACLHLSCNFAVRFGMSVRNKSIIFETHIQLLFYKKALSPKL